MITLGDCYIGNFPQTQDFGERPNYYKQFGLSGHEGIDIGCPEGTPIVSATDGVIIRDIDDPVVGKNYGVNVVVWDKNQLCATYYCHLRNNVVSVGQAVIKGQLLGYSDTTGNTTGPHLHFNLCKTDAQGNRLNQDNGYFGFINPNDKRIVTWDIKNPTKPMEPPVITQPVAIPVNPDQVKVDIGGAFGVMEVQAVRSTLNDLLKTKSDLESKLNGFVVKWVQEYRLSTDSGLVQVELEMAKLLPLEDKYKSTIDAIEKVVGIFTDDNARLVALGAVKNDIKSISDERDNLLQKLEDAKTPKGYKIWKSWTLFGDRFLVKSYRKG